MKHFVRFSAVLLALAVGLCAQAPGGLFASPSSASGSLPEYPATFSSTATVAVNGTTHGRGNDADVSRCENGASPRASLAFTRTRDLTNGNIVITLTGGAATGTCYIGATSTSALVATTTQLATKMDRVNGPGVVVVDGSGNASVATGNDTDCVRKNGTTGACGTGGGSVASLADIPTRNYSDLQNIPTTFTPAAHNHTSAAVTDFSTAALSATATAYPPTARTITAGTGLTGGGDLTSNRTLSADIASQAEAEAGSSSSKVMTPQRVAQYVAAVFAGCNVSSGAWTCPGAISSQGTTAGELRLYESAVNGTEYSGWKAPASIAASYTPEIPAAPPSGTQGLQCSTPSGGVSTCTWATVSGGSGSRTVELSAARCQAGAPMTGFNLPSSNAPAAQCDTDGKPVLTFSATNQAIDPESIVLPATLTSIALTWPVRASASSSNVSGSATGQVAYTCVAIDGTGTTAPTLSTTANATATWATEAGNLAKPMAFTISTAGCAGKRLYWKFTLTSFTTFTSIQAINTISVIITP